MEKWIYFLRQKLASRKSIGIVLILVVFAVLFVLIYRERTALFDYPWQIKPENLLFFIPSRILAISAQLMCWHMTLRRINGTSLLKLDARIYTLSVVTRRIPGTIWHVASKFALYSPNLVSTSSLVIASSLEYVLIVLSGLLFYFLLMPFYTFFQDWPWQIFLGVGAVLLIVSFAKPNLLVTITNFFLQKFKHPPIYARIFRADLLIWLLLHSLTWLFDGASFYFWLGAVTGEPIGFLDILGISTISNLVSFSAQILPAGFALREITAGSLLGHWIPVSVGVIIALSYRIGMILVEVTLAILAYAALREPDEKKNAA